MFVTSAKKVLDKKISNSFYESLRRFGFSPNRFTLLSLLFKLAAIYFFYHGEFLIGAILGGLDYLFDFYDGAMARHLGEVTKRGGLMDFMFDRVFRELWFVALALGGWVPGWIIILTVAVNGFNYYLRDYIETKNLIHLKWLPANYKFVFIGALVPAYMSQILFVGVLINAVIFVGHFGYIFWKNSETEELT